MSPNASRLLLLVLAGAFLAAVAVLLAAPSADASIVGTPLPPEGSDWVIDQNTTVLGETITLTGSIMVQPGFTLAIKNTVLTFNSTSPGQCGIDVPAGSPENASLDISETTIKAEVPDLGWFFTIRGDANVHGGVQLLNVHNGVYIYGSTVTFDGVKVQSYGTYGMYIYTCDPTVINCQISNENDVVGSWSGTQSRPDPATGMYIYGTSSRAAAPTLDNLSVNVKIVDTWDQTVSSSSIYEYIYAYGLDVTYANLGVLSDMSITFDISTYATIRYSSSTLYFRVYTYVYGIRLQGGTMLDGFDNVRIDTSTYYTDVLGVGITNGYLYEYFYWYGVYNTISPTSGGRAPEVIDGLTIQGHHATYNGNNVFNTVYVYPYGRAIYWLPSTTAPTSGYLLTDVDLIDLDVQYMFELRNSWEFTMRNCRIEACNIGGSTSGYIFYLSSWRYRITIENNTITRNVHRSAYLFYLYYSYADVTFSGNEVTDNTIAYFIYSYRVQSGVRMTLRENNFNGNTFSSYMFYIYYPYGTVLLDGNKLVNNKWNSYFAYCYYMYGTVTWTNNLFDGNTGSSMWFYAYYVQSGGEFNFEQNTVQGNSFTYGAYCYGNYGPIRFTDNVFQDNRYTSTSYAPIYLYYSYNNYEIERNAILNNTIVNYFFYIGYFGYPSKSSTLSLRGNEFIGNKGDTKTLAAGLVYFYYLNVDVTVNDNFFGANDAHCIVNYYPYPNYAYTFTVLGNTFVNNTGKSIVGNEIDNMKFRVRANYATLNLDYCVFLEQTSTTINGPDGVYIEENNFTRNPGGAIFLRTCAYNPAYGTSYGNPDAEIVVKSNRLNDNGAGGWALAAVGLYQSPTTKANDWTGSAMGQFLGLINDDPRRVPFEITMRNVVVDGDTDGVTAYGFEGIDAELYYCSFTNFTEAIYAKDCTVNVWWSAVPEASGWTEGKGRIYVYNHLEIYTTWANEYGIDSGHPVAGATLALQGANSKYINPFKVDANGRYGPVVMSPWSCVDGQMDAWAPFEATVSQGNVSTTQKGHFVGEMVFPDNPMHLILIDNRIPEVIISNPQNDTLLNSPRVNMEGILFEAGSGIETFETQTDMMGPDEWKAVSINIFWSHVFTGFPQGSHWIRLRAGDLAGNWNDTTVNFVIDLTPPQLDVWVEYKNTTRLPGSSPYYVRTSELVINGTYQDDFAALEDILIRLNGVRMVIQPNRCGTIYHNIELSQGLNMLRIDATDTAANVVTVEYNIYLDFHGPVLYVYSPLQNEATGSTTMTVRGLTEGCTPVRVKVESTTGSQTKDTVSLDDGNFSVVVDLFEGYQRVIVTATDAAGNEVMVTRDIVRDTTPPEFEMTDPAAGVDVITNRTEYTIKGHMVVEAGVMLYINEQLVPNPGTFERTIVLKEGDNLVEVLAVDSVGNTKLVRLNIVRDTVRPTLLVTAPSDTYVLTTSPTVHFAGTCSGADATEGGIIIELGTREYRADLVSGEWGGAAVWAYDLELRPEDLDQYITVRAVDRAGNDRSWTCHVIYDVIPPSLDLDMIPASVTDPSVVISGTTDDDVQLVYIQGIPYPVTRGEFSVPFSLQPGNNTVTVEVRDVGGNVRSDSLTTTYNYEQYVPPAPSKQVKEDHASYVWSAILFVIAMTVLVTSLFLFMQSRRRR